MSLPLWTRDALQVALLCWLSHLHLMVGDRDCGRSSPQRRLPAGEVGQLGRAKPLCLKFTQACLTGRFFPISVYHGPVGWANAREGALGACSSPGPGGSGDGCRSK